MRKTMGSRLTPKFRGFICLENTEGKKIENPKRKSRQVLYYKKK